MRPDVGTQSNFRKKKAPTTYRDDSSLSPALDWDGQNGARELVSVSSLSEAVAALKRIGEPFLTWTGKAERLSFDVPTLPLFVHERLSTKAIVDTLVGHKRDKQIDMYSLTPCSAIRNTRSPTRC